MAEADTELREIWKSLSEEERNEWKSKREAPVSKVDQVKESAPFVVV
jgi:hypothetical protein